MTVAGVNSNAMALSLDPFPRSAASAAALVGGLQMTMGALASAFLSALSLRPAVEMGLGMTIAGLISMSLIGLGVLRGRQQDVRTL
jgi:DHA1 family bicyclomycin/chloramphenicol resistance-like MFS transporter